MTRYNGNCKVVLISLYSSDGIGLRYIYSFLQKNGVEVHLIFFKEKYLEADIMSLPTENEYKLLLDLIKKLKPRIVGISLRSSFFKMASEITERIRKELGVPVIWGGTHPNVAPEECIQIADMICLGEGEYPMLNLAQRISEGQDIHDIQNLWVRNGKEVTRNSLGMLIRDLDSLPFPDYGIDGKYFIEKDAVSSDPALHTFNLNILASRGCPYHCTYCCNSIFRKNHKGKGPAIRRRTVENVIGEIEYLRDKFPNLKRVDFIDEVFAWDKSWTSKFCSQYKEKVNLPFHCFQHPNMVDKDILGMLKGAGLERVDIGIQSGSERVRKEVFERPVSDEILLKAARFISDLNMIPFYDLIVDNPFETEDDKRLGLYFMLKLPRPFYLWMFPLIYFPNTPLTKKALESHYITIDQVESKAERTHQKFFVKLDYPWSDQERFWISLFSLTSKSFIPKKLIRWLSRSMFLKKHPKPLSAFATISNNIKLGTIAIRWLLQGKSIKDIFRQTSRKQSHRIV